MRLVLVMAVVLTMAGCQLANPFSEAGSSPTRHMVTVHIRIDDEVIDGGNPWKVIEPVWWTVDIYDGEAEYESSLAAFSKEQRYLLAVNWYMAEVSNGGHEQFYDNSTGIVWKDALAGFRDLGVNEAAEIVEESAIRLGGDPSLDREARWEQLDAYQPTFDDLDDRFYDLDERINLDAVMQAYIMQHREAFYYEGDVSMPSYFTQTRED